MNRPARPDCTRGKTLLQRTKHLIPPPYERAVTMGSWVNGLCAWGVQNPALCKGFEPADTSIPKPTVLSPVRCFGLPMRGVSVFGIWFGANTVQGAAAATAGGQNGQTSGKCIAHGGDPAPEPLSAQEQRPVVTAGALPHEDTVRISPRSRAGAPILPENHAAWESPGPRHAVMRAAPGSHAARR
jgi:hypothetical protein